MKKQFFRVKQLADQTFLKADKSEVLNHEELQIADQKVEYLRNAISAITKKLPSASQANDFEKRAKKCVEYHLGHVFIEQAKQVINQEDECHLFQSILRECGQVEMTLAREYFDHESKVEEMVTGQLQSLLDNDFPNILKQKRNLSKYILDKDSASNRYNSTKKEALKDDMEEADTKVEQSRDLLAVEMFGLLARENELSSYILQLLKLQRGYHESALKNLEGIIPELEKKIGDSNVKRVFGISLEEHLRVTRKKIALPLEICITVLSKIGMSEEGLFRIGGSMSRVKRLKASIDSGCLTCLIPEYQDVHVLASTLKLYLRELPEPILTFYLHNEWMKAMQYNDHKQRLEAVKHVLPKLPQENYDNLSYLMHFFAKLSHHHENKMSSSNIAIVIAPNLLWDKNEDVNLNMGNCAIVNMLVELFIKEVDYCFPDDVNKLVNTPLNLFHDDDLHRVQSNHYQHQHNNKEADVIEFNVSTESIQNLDSPRPNSRKKKTAAPVPPNNLPLTNSKTDNDIVNERINSSTSMAASYPSGSSTLNRPQKPKEIKMKQSVGINTEENSLSLSRKNIAITSEDNTLSSVTTTTVTHNKEPKLSNLVNLDNTKIVEHKYVTQPAANIHLSKAKPVQQIIAQNTECDVTTNNKNFKTTITHQINHNNMITSKPIAAPRTLLQSDEKIVRTPSLRNNNNNNNNNNNSNNDVMSKSVELYSDVQLRVGKPEVPARPASLQKRSSTDLLHIDPSSLQKTQCSVYSVANKQQPSIVNLQNRTEKFLLGHDYQITEKEKFLGHHQHVQPNSNLENRFIDVNSNNDTNLQKQITITAKPGLPPKSLVKSTEKLNLTFRSNEHLDATFNNDCFKDFDNNGQQMNEHNIPVTNGNNQKPSHFRTKSDGNFIDLNQQSPTSLIVPSSPRSLNKPTQPPPPPPISVTTTTTTTTTNSNITTPIIGVKKEPESTDL